MVADILLHSKQGTTLQSMTSMGIDPIPEFDYFAGEVYHVIEDRLDKG